MSSSPLQKRPTLLHQHVSGRLYRAIADWVDSPSGRGTVLLPLSIAIGPGNAYTPGLMWFEDELSLDAERVPRMPDLLIRVDDGAGLRAQDDWQYGMRELWLVNLDSLDASRCTAATGPGNAERTTISSRPRCPASEVQVDALFL